MFRANLALQPYGYWLGPDPASSGVATVGGVIANNASGMCCGTVENSYKTLESIWFLLPSGTRINSADPEAEKQFNLDEPELLGVYDHPRETRNGLSDELFLGLDPIAKLATSDK
jgi:D-lactate dehydrogenase